MYSIVLSQLYFVRLDEHFVVMIICIILIQYNVIPTEEFFIFEFIPNTFLISIIEILKIYQTNCYVHLNLSIFNLIVRFITGWAIQLTKWPFSTFKSQAG